MRDPSKDYAIFLAFKRALVESFGFDEQTIQTPADLVNVYEDSKRTVSKQKGVMEQTSYNLKRNHGIQLSAKQLSHYYAKTFSKHGKHLDISRSGKQEAIRELVRDGVSYRRKCEVVQQAMELLGPEYAKSSVETFVYKEWKNIEKPTGKIARPNQTLFKESVIFSPQEYCKTCTATPTEPYFSDAELIQRLLLIMSPRY